jgi:hypothetical protein
LNAFVDAYPDLKWEVGIEATFDTSGFWKDSEKEENGRKVLKLDERKGKQAFTIEPKIKRTYNGEGPKEVGYSHKAELDKILGVMNWAAEKLEWLLVGLYDLTGTKFSFKSKIGLSGTWGWEEVKGQWKCGFGGNVKLSFDPLFETTIDMDITDVILTLLATGVPATAPVVMRIKGWRASQRGARLRYSASGDQKAAGYVIGGVYLKVTGGIGFELKWDKKAEEEKWKRDAVAGKVYIDIDIRCSLEGKGKVKFWRLEGSAGATLEVGAKSGVKAEDIKADEKNGQMMLGCRITFNGITLRGLAAGDANIKWGSKEEEEEGWQHTHEGGYTSEAESGESKTKSGFSGSYGAEGASLKYTPAGGNVETKDKTAGGQEYTKKKTESSVEGSANKQGAGVKGSYNIEYTVWAPKTWNNTDEVDDKGNQPLGMFHLWHTGP